MIEYNNVVITGANSLYFESVLTLISSIHKDSLDIVDQILVFDFGLDPSEIQKLDSLKKVKAIQFDKTMFPFFESMSSVKTKCHFLKMFALRTSKKIANNILWLDAGVCALKSISPIFEIIEKDHIFLVGDIHLNKNFTHQRCIKIMSATEDELNDRQLSSGILGYKSDGIYLDLIEDSWDYSLVEGCIDGFEDNHRHDQSVLSILSSRYKCKTHDIDKYGYWTSLDRNLRTAIEADAVIFVHRRGYINKEHLIYEV